MSDAGPSPLWMLANAVATGADPSIPETGEFSIWSVVILLILIGVNAFFAAAEIAVISFNDNKLEVMAEDGNRKAKQLLRIVKEPSKFFATIQIGVTLSGMLSSAFTADTFAGLLASWIYSFWQGLPYGTLQTISMVLLTILLSFDIFL